MQLEDKHFPVNRTATMGGVVLVDPATKKPYKAGVTIQQVDGGFDPTGLATDTGQEVIVQALEDLLAAVRANATNGEVSIADEELPPVAGGATATKQDAILAALQNLAGVLGGTLTVTAAEPIAVTAENVPLPAGSSTAARQDAILSALNALAEIFRTETLDVTGSVSVEGTVPISGAVSLSNASIAVTPSGTFTVDLPGSATSAKQDAILSALGSLLTAIQAPQVITDGGQSITVDGVVGVSGTIPVTQSGSWTTAATQSGTWNVGISGTPTVNVGNTVTISDGSGPLTVDGAVSATITGTPNVNVTNTSLPVNVGNTVNVSDGNGSLTVDGAVSATVTNTSLPVTQSGTWNVGVTGTPNVNISNTSVPVSGSVGITGTPNVNVANASPIPVSLPGTQPVSLASVPSHPVTQSSTWDVNVTNSNVPVSLSSVPTHAVTQSGTWTWIPANAATLSTPPTAVSVGTTSTQLVTANTNRKALIIQNMGNTTLMVCFAATAVVTTPTFQVPANNWIVIERDVWTGVVTAIRPSGSATADAVVTVTS